MKFEEQPPHRQLFARQVLAKAGVANDPRLLDALASVEREPFFGPPPWFYSDFSTYRELASHDPVVLYQDMLVALDPARHVNNGVPSLHAGALNQLESDRGNGLPISAPGPVTTLRYSLNWLGRQVKSPPLSTTGSRPARQQRRSGTEAMSRSFTAMPSPFRKKLSTSSMSTSRWTIRLRPGSINLRLAVASCSRWGSRPGAPMGSSCRLRAWPGFS